MFLCPHNSLTIMSALLRLTYFPSTTAHFLPSFQPKTLLISHTNTTNSKRPNLQLFLIRAQAQAQTQPTIHLETAKENIVEEAAANDEGVPNTRVLVQNVPWTCAADDIRPLFEKYGTVVDIEFFMYNKTRNRGIAFVTMASHEEALAVVNNLESTEFEGRVLNLDWAKPKKKRYVSPPRKPKPIHNLYVANLAYQARAKDLKELFNGENGNVVSAEVIFKDKPKGSAGYGFVSFNTKEEAEAALATFHGKEFMGRSLRVARSRKYSRDETTGTIPSEILDAVL
ncbi:hypothetical protein ACJIZ3_003172 [Penstemon smallii]|uniref:RRM domain-containing protein n=1 Tax=Penstemon smallii TaxID=265156 RepID=A0ABD3U8G8_9LAMI